MTNIYLADDDNDDKDLLEQATAEVCPDITLHHALDGNLLLKKLDKNFPPPPDAIFLDINMPVLNGYDSLKHIRDDERFKNIPVIIYSTSSTPYDIDAMYTAGADLYITKPLSFAGIKEMMKQVCDMHFGEGYIRPSRSNFHLSF